MTETKEHNDCENTATLLGGNRKLPTTWNELSKELKVVKYERAEERRKDRLNSIDREEAELIVLKKIIEVKKNRISMKEVNDRLEIKIEKLKKDYEKQKKLIEKYNDDLDILLTEKKLLNSQS